MSSSIRFLPPASVLEVIKPVQAVYNYICLCVSLWTLTDHHITNVNAQTFSFFMIYMI